jgi:hypothetical protein
VQRWECATPFLQIAAVGMSDSETDSSCGGGEKVVAEERGGGGGQGRCEAVAE